MKSTLKLKQLMRVHYFPVGNVSRIFQLSQAIQLMNVSAGTSRREWSVSHSPDDVRIDQTFRYRYLQFSARESSCLLIRCFFHLPSLNLDVFLGAFILTSMECGGILDGFSATIYSLCILQQSTWETTEHYSTFGCFPATICKRCVIITKRGELVGVVLWLLEGGACRRFVETWGRCAMTSERVIALFR